MGEGAGFLLLDTRFEVNLADPIQSPINIVSKKKDLFFGDVGQLRPLCVQKFVNDGLKVLSFEIVEIEFARCLDKLHYLETVAVCLDPKFVFGLLSFDLGQHAEEHLIHLIHKVVEVRTANVRVVIDLLLYFGPQHLRTVVMKLCTAISSQKSLFAYDGWAFAGWVHADSIHFTTVGAVSSHVFDPCTRFGALSVLALT